MAKPKITRSAAVAPTATPPVIAFPAALPCRETIESLEQLLEDAKRGHVIGIAYAALYRRRNFVTNVTGDIYRNPTFGRGMVRALDDHLAELMYP